MNKFFRRGILILLPAIIISFFPFSRGVSTQHNSDNELKIDILSKHLKLLKEGEIGELIFSLPPGSTVRYDDSELYSSSLKICYSEKDYRVFTGNRSLNFTKCTIYNNTPGTLSTINIDTIKRSYPLPLEIIHEKGSVRIFLHEIPAQFAVDSASAELGYVKPENSEALYALALAIHGRSRIYNLKNKHDRCDFCDLTCCQTYKGRSGLKPLSGPFIDTSDNGYGFFFHSSSGGRLFTESVFNTCTRKVKPPADVLFSENFLLSRNLYKTWSAVITKNELSAIISPDKKLLINEICYFPEREIISMDTSEGNTIIAPEELRLKLNRKKGWNFLRSNNYTLAQDNTQYIFSGSGLGHCTGMSLEGAVQLAERGYSRYEILEHYYPDLKYLNNLKQFQSYQYVTYDLSNSNIIFSSTGPSLLERRIPAGSLFKLFTVIYLASERRDLFFNHTFQCSSENSSPLPEHCWDREGHGTTDIRSAIYNSCNIWFASLHDRINKEDYKNWFSRFVKSRGITVRLPEITNEKEWSDLLAGLDFRTDISVRDIIKLSSFIHNPDRTIPPDASEIINTALKKTFTDGTAKMHEKTSSLRNENTTPSYGLWGKTGTVIAGTNSHYSYGLFTGGLSDTGIIVILRKGKGAGAAHIAIPLLTNSN